MDRAELSVVVPSVNGLKDLMGTLEALAANQDVRLEVLVPERCGDDVRAAVRARFPQVRVIPVDRDTTIPEMRALAFAAATAESIAVIEDHVLVPSGWARALLEAQRRGEQVVGGGVLNAATDRTVDWAAFLCEYSHLLPPLPDGPSTWLTGNNTVYRRALLQQYGGEAAGAWEDRLHEVLRGHGVTLFFRPEIVVQHKKHYTVGEYLSQRYLYARAYAGAKFSQASPLRRAVGGVAAFALPPVLFRRIVWRVFKAGRHRAELARSLPLLALFVSSWAVGEAVGAWAGSGKSLSRVC
jgi:GT2 family glycosyltransferase